MQPAPADPASLAQRRALVELLHAAGHLHSPRVAAALAAVPRELFVPGLELQEVYRPGEAIVTKRVDGVGVSSASAPNVVALMLEQLDPLPGQRVLEIGAGTGYNAALLAHLVGPSGYVATLDIDEDLVAAAKQHLHAAGFDQVEVLTQDGALGHPAAHSVFDRIILTVASRDIAPAWREQLARPGGRLVLPLAIRGLQRSVAFEPEDGHLVSTSLQACHFIPLRGLLAASSLRVPLGPDGALSIALPDEASPPPADAFAAFFGQPKYVWPTGVSAGLDEVRDGLHLWLVAHDPGVYSVWAEPGVRLIPDLFGVADRVRASLCAVDAQGVAMLGWAGDGRHTGELSVTAPLAGEAVAQHLVELLRAWAAAGRPRDSQVQIRAYACGDPAAPPAAADEVTIAERWTRFVLRWRAG
jgi:protein-L-isoaspartate(D-aspartate) O-methyltransferase